MAPQKRVGEELSASIGFRVIRLDNLVEDFVPANHAEILPGAFDGRPVVTALHADDPYGPRSARAWTFALSTGYRFRCAWHRGALQVTAEATDSQEARR